jgi:ferredoxin-NADP reductase/predicted pyridoxine 5'-phosphate oxidase superfamily flavin-nucleotide-binding protein
MTGQIQPQLGASSPWHAGEIAMQKSVGVAERMAEVGKRVVRDHLIEQHRAFYPQLPFVALGAIDSEGEVWATLRAGKPGFLQSPDPYTLHLNLPRDPADPAEAGMEDGQPMALLGIELHTRRRNRLNGKVRRDAGLDAGRSFDLLVQQSYGNCPQYIQLRDFAFSREPTEPAAHQPVESTGLDAAAREMIAKADTFFVATYATDTDGMRQVDVSHRGGKAGFVRIDADGGLTIPDFAGNLFFNTLGNILANPRAGLVFVDFASGDLLQLSGAAEVLFDSPETAAFQGAERLWRFTPRRVIHRADALPLRWAFRSEGWSPNSLMTGDWQTAAQRLTAAELARAWRPFRIAAIVDEAAGIRSFQLEPADEAGLIPHQAGQHLPIRVRLPGSEAPTLRNYSLSLAPSDGSYRISVKREGAVSQYLHSLRSGELIETRAPAGAFTIDAAQRRPAVLLAAGIGITPILAMLRHLVYEGLRTRRVRPARVYYSARTLAERAFDRELSALLDRAGSAVGLVRVLSQPGEALQGRDYEFAGRIDIGLLKSTLPFDDYDFYLCGPPSFMQASYDSLRQLNIADRRIHAEAFGPGGVVRKPDAGAAARDLGQPATRPVPVAFVKSGKEARWSPGDGSLLELAESRGLQPEFSCRAGSCGSCRTRLLSGSVAYTREPSAAIGPGEALLCCAVPAAEADGSASPLQLNV